jgi:hypothetical protein
MESKNKKLKINIVGGGLVSISTEILNAMQDTFSHLKKSCFRYVD